MGKRGRALQTVAEKADITSVTNVISAFDVYRLSATGSFPKALLSRVTVLFQIKSLNQIPIPMALDNQSYCPVEERLILFNGYWFFIKNGVVGGGAC